jgi:hypothetical protein
LSCILTGIAVFALPGITSYQAEGLTYWSTSKGISWALWGPFWSISCLGKWLINRTIPKIFIMSTAQEWGRATRDYKKFMHKKLRQGRRGVNFLIWFSHQLPLQWWSERKTFMQEQGEQSMCPCINKKLNLLTQDFQGHLRFLISDDKFLWRLLRVPQASSVMCRRVWLASPLSGNRDSPSSSAIGYLLFWSIHDRAAEVALGSSLPNSWLSAFEAGWPFCLRMSIWPWGHPYPGSHTHSLPFFLTLFPFLPGHDC